MQASPASAGQTWNAYTYNSVGTVTAAKGLVELFDEIGRRTNGELTVKLHLGGTLQIKATDITQAVADNIVQLGDDAFFLGSVPIGAVVRLPMLVHSPAEYEKVAAIAAPALSEAYAKRGIVVVGEYVFPEQVIWSRKELKSLRDIQGQKIRVISPDQAEFIKRMGGSPVTLGTAEVPAALDRGVVDGAITASSGYGYVWRDLFKYNYRLNLGYVSSLLLANKRAWDRLSPSVQATVKETIREVTDKTTKAMAAEDQELTQKLAAQMTATTPSAADVEDAQQRISSYYDDWAKSQGPDAAELLGKVRKALER
ncbi:TRAP transporter substrate-binding protein DctP [Bradyrhizobium monzae]|uniref:TRAP transporter substrate-binding protein DctP n=1 Tax=Bradyrhizobium sp. Oc8 TaxID=2876780 RepID=UPI001F28226E|nr:TRAP transporter substrate-binding protein DctP [Bradyrhizobium sp. Oc8]